MPAVGGAAPGSQPSQPSADAQAGAAPSGPDQMIGQVIDNRYRILNMLGEGGMGEVYAAEHVHIEKRVAIKLLRSEIITNEQAVIRFRREAKETSSIGHRNIIAIEDFGTLPDGRIYLAMELLAGRPLNEMLHDAATGAAPLDTGRLLHILIQVGHGLAAAHQKGIVHRDMKPENVFITTGSDGKDVPKILDFGIAKVSGADGNNHLTQTGTIFGTPYYMAPEQALGQTVDHRADIYAMGVIMYESFTGALPFVGESFMGILTQHITAEPAPPSQAAQAQGRQLDPRIEGIIVRAMTKDANERYQTMDELIEALVAVYREVSGPGMSTFLEAQPVPGSAQMGAVSAPMPTPTPPPHGHGYGQAPTPPPHGHGQVPTPPPHGQPPISQPHPHQGGSGVYAAPEPGANKKGKGGLIAAILAVVLLGGGGAGAFAYFGGGGGDDDPDDDVVAQADEADDAEGAAGDEVDDSASEPATEDETDIVAVAEGEADAGADVEEAAADFDAAVEEVAAEPAQVLVNSRPQGAAIMRQGERLGTTPTLIEVADGESLELTLRRRGRQPTTITVDGSEAQIDANLPRAQPQRPPDPDPDPEPQPSPDPEPCDPSVNPACLLE